MVSQHRSVPLARRPRYGLLGILVAVTLVIVSCNTPGEGKVNSPVRVSVTNACGFPVFVAVYGDETFSFGNIPRPVELEAGHSHYFPLQGVREGRVRLVISEGKSDEGRTVSYFLDELPHFSPRTFNAIVAGDRCPGVEVSEEHGVVALGRAG